jgi:RND family efflux transporter MFP subunit
VNLRCQIIGGFASAAILRDDESLHHGATMHLADRHRPSRIAPLVAAIVFALATNPLLAQQAAPARVHVERVAEAAGGQAFTLTGTLTAERSAGLSPRLDGLVQSVRVDAGDRVREGAVLLELDATLARLVLERLAAGRVRAQAQHDEAARRVAEAEPLVAQRSLPQTELGARRASLALAASDLRAAIAAEREQAELVERHRLRAPFAGVIAMRNAEAGEWVVRGTPILQLVDLDAIRLDVQAPQERFADLPPGTVVAIEADVNPGVRVPARIAARVPVTSDTASRTFLVRVVADDPTGGLLPGTSAQARFEIARAQATLQVPRDALLRHPDGGFSVFIVAGSGAQARAVRRSLRLGREAGGRVEVLDGLAAGDLVVVRGNEALQDAQPVVVLPDAPGG